MTDRTGSMFDYDARPITPQVVLVGRRAFALGYELRDFLSRNGVPYDWVEIDDVERMRPLFGGSEVDFAQLPICVLPDGSRLRNATLQQVAVGLGLVAKPRLSDYDIVIVGAGPTGLAAAVYAASEGLRTIVIEALAPGGQAGTTSLIENYLGFPQGISGSELATRASSQARRFGAEVLLARQLEEIVGERDSGYGVGLSDGTRLRTRTVLVATGVAWRRLDLGGLDALLGAGVYYGAGPSEALTCQGCRVAIIGGGNSAGQAAVRFSRYASQVTLLVRSSTLGASMSEYLVSKLSELDNVEVRTETVVVGLEADQRLRGITLRSQSDPELTALPIDSLFVCIGGVPRTRGLSESGVATDDAGYILTGPDAIASRAGTREWPLARSPLPLETNRPGLFAAGDVRSGSIKRCAAAIGEGSMAVALVHRRLTELDSE
jgi:thioredoxin reductase (NADPH)